MEEQLTVSIIINNYNYGRFLKKAISSVLLQTVAPYEIILVDDGSTDNSLSVANEFKNVIHIIAKENGGQASAFNTGFAASTGNWIWFLDADDWLEYDAVERITTAMKDDLSKIQAKLRAVAENEELLGTLVPDVPLSSGNVKEEIIKTSGYGWPPTTGNVFARWMLERCLPMPEEEYKLCADLYICTYAGVLGDIYTLPNPVGFYRVHRSNGFFGFRMNAKWLQTQGKNLLLAQSLTQELIRKYTPTKDYQYKYSRKNIEMLLLAYRFSNLKNETSLTERGLYKDWKQSDEIKARKGIKYLTAKLYWIILLHAPKEMVYRFLQLSIWKAQRANKIKTNSNKYVI